jgi:hypothetical protein
MQPERQPRLRRLAALTGAGVLAAGLMAAAPASSAFAAPPAPVDGPQGVNEVMKSENVELLSALPRPQGHAATHSDLAFQGDYAFSGTYNGVVIYDVSDPAEPEIVTNVICPASQNDVSVYKNLMFLSVDGARNGTGCDSGAGSAQNPEHFEGVRVFDISDIRNPEYVAAVRTDCGSHTHTLAPSKDLESVYVYVSSYSPSAANAYCKPPHDKLSVIDVPLDAPETASVVSTPVVFPEGGYTNTSGCHDLTTFASRDVMAGACMGDGVIFDISDRENPVVVDEVRDTENFAFWHSATYNNAGNKVVFTDELGGGTQQRCRLQDYPVKGADAIYDIEGGDELVFKSYFKINRIQTVSENCVAHNGSLIPVKGKDIMVQAWYHGGLSVWDFTDSANPVELGYYERGPLPQTGTNPNSIRNGGNWSTYWFNGYIYSNEIARGFDSYELFGEEFEAAKAVRSHTINPQTQTLYVEAVDFGSLRTMIDEAAISSSARSSLLNRLDRTEAQAAKGSEAGAYTSLKQLIDRANNQIKGDADDIATRNAIVAAAQAFHDDIKAADYYEH